MLRYIKYQRIKKLRSHRVIVTAKKSRIDTLFSNDPLFIMAMTPIMRSAQNVIEITKSIRR